MNLEEQIQEAIVVVKGMFVDHTTDDILPVDATIESLWVEIAILKKEIASLKKTKRGIRPRVEDAVKLLIENIQLNQIPIPMIAEIVREVFKLYGIPSKCSSSSVRWYLSNRSLEWDIIRRKMPPIETGKKDS